MFTDAAQSALVRHLHRAQERRPVSARPTRGRQVSVHSPKVPFPTGRGDRDRRDPSAPVSHSRAVISSASGGDGQEGTHGRTTVSSALFEWGTSRAFRGGKRDANNAVAQLVAGFRTIARAIAKDPIGATMITRTVLSLPASCRPVRT